MFDFSRTFRGVNTDFFFNFSDIFLISPTSDPSDLLLNRAVRAVPRQESEQSCICVLEVPSQESERLCICVLEVPSQESERLCICVLEVPSQESERSCIGVLEVPRQES